MSEPQVLTDEDIKTTWTRAGAGGAPSLHADPDATDPDTKDSDGTDADSGTDADGTDSDADSTDS